MPPRKPDWAFGMILERRGRVRVMFIRFDEDRTRMVGGGLLQFVGMRLDNNDGTRPASFTPGSVGNYSLPGWQLVDDAMDAEDREKTAPISYSFPPSGGLFAGRATGSGGRDHSIGMSRTASTAIVHPWSEDPLRPRASKA